MKDKGLKQLTLKNVIFIITYTILLVLCVMRLDVVGDIVAKLFSLFTPFIIAFAMAFIFHIPMRFFIKRLPSEITKGRKRISVVLSLVCIFVVLMFIVNMVAPTFGSSIQLLIKEFPIYMEETIELAQSYMKEWGVDKDVLNLLSEYGSQIEETIMNVAGYILPNVISFTKSIFSMITSFVMAIVIAVYFIISKDTLVGQAKKTLYAFLPEKQYAWLVKTIKLTHITFVNFFSGQLVEAIIIGVLCYIGCIILNIEYAPILSVIIGCTNVIPIFGPIIGALFCGVLLLFVNPMNAIIFTIFGICLQQFESNIIYPRVVGSSVGLSGLWTLMAVSIGGGLFGIIGMVLGLPTFAVIYKLLSEEINKRYNSKQNKKVVLTHETVGSE